MADDFDIEAMLEAPYKKVGIQLGAVNFYIQLKLQSNLRLVFASLFTDICHVCLYDSGFNE